MPTEIDKLNTKIDRVLQENQRILFYLYNDNQTDTKGIIQQVRDLCVDVKKIKDEMAISAARRAAIGTMFGAAGGILSGAVILVVKLFIK